MHVAILIVLDELNDVFVVFVVRQFADKDEVAEIGLFAQFVRDEDYAVLEQGYRFEWELLLLYNIQQDYLLGLIIHPHFFWTMDFPEKGGEQGLQLQQPLPHQKLLNLIIGLMH